MILAIIGQTIRFIASILIMIVIVDTILVFFVSPLNSIRRFFGKIVNPLKRPIQKVVPLIGSIDFSPFILILLIEICSNAFVILLKRIG